MNTHILKLDRIMMVWEKYKIDKRFRLKPVDSRSVVCFRCDLTVPYFIWFSRQRSAKVRFEVLEKEGDKNMKSIYIVYVKYKRYWTRSNIRSFFSESKICNKKQCKSIIFIRGQREIFLLSFVLSRSCFWFLGLLG